MKIQSSLDSGDILMLSLREQKELRVTKRVKDFQAEDTGQTKA